MKNVPLGLVRSSDADAGSPLRDDSLSAGVALLLGMTVVQRLIGFLRSVMFCSLLEDDQLGRWSLALIFLVLAAPLAVAGLPGSFGRYVEYYRHRGLLRPFLFRTTLATALLGSAAALLVLAAPRWLAICLFRDTQQTDLAILLAGALAAVIGCNFLNELFNALRQVRVASVMQLISSLVFALLSIALLTLTELREEAVIVAFGASSLAAAVYALIRLRPIWRALPVAADQLPHRELWKKLLPFAAWVWVGNLLANLFVGADQYMIKQFSGVSAAAADSMVGQYHCSRVVPVLLVSLAGMFGAFLLPYLSMDWESGRRDRVSQRLNLALKLIGLAFTGVGVLVLLTSPVLFGWVFRGRYDEGLSVLPWTLVYCIWFSLATVAQNYLWCAEKARLSGFAAGMGLVANIVLNLLLLPRFGLIGAVLATAAANAAALVLILTLNRRLGMQLDRGVWLTALLPLSFVAGAGPAAIALICAAWLAGRTSLLLDNAERQLLSEAAAPLLARLQRAVNPCSTVPS